MVQGQKVSPDENLVMYNVRLERETKQLLQALVQVQKLPGGQRDLIDQMLQAYREKFPATFKRAAELIQILNSEK